MEPWREKDITAAQEAGEYGSPQSGSRSDTSQDGNGSALPLQEDGYPLPTQEQIDSVNRPRGYHLPSGAIMTLTIPSLGLKNAPS